MQKSPAQYKYILYFLCEFNDEKLKEKQKASLVFDMVGLEFRQSSAGSVALFVVCNLLTKYCIQTVQILHVGYRFTLSSMHS